MLSNSLVQVSVDGWGHVLSLLFHLRPNCGGGDEDHGDLLQKARRAVHALLHAVLQPCSWPPPTHASAGDSWALTGQSGSLVGSSLLSPGLWCAQGLVCAFQEYKKLYYVKLGECMLFYSVYFEQRHRRENLVGLRYWCFYFCL